MVKEAIYDLSIFILFSTYLWYNRYIAGWDVLQFDLEIGKKRDITLKGLNEV